MENNIKFGNNPLGLLKSCKVKALLPKKKKWVER